MENNSSASKEKHGTIRKPINRSLEGEFNNIFTSPSAQLPAYQNSIPTTNSKPPSAEQLSAQNVAPPINPLSIPSVPESYLSAMMSLQEKYTQLEQKLAQSETRNQQLTTQNKSLKVQLLQSQQEKLEYETKINSLLKDYNTLNEVLGQTRLQMMVCQKEIEQLKIEKQNVLEKVTERINKERAISVLEQKTQDYTNHSASKARGGRNTEQRYESGSKKNTIYNTRPEPQMTAIESTVMSGNYTNNNNPSHNQSYHQQFNRNNGDDSTPNKRESMMRGSSMSKFKENSNTHTIIKNLDGAVGKGDSTFRNLEEDSSRPLLSDAKRRYTLLQGASGTSLLSNPTRYEQLLEDSTNLQARQSSQNYSESYISLVKDIMRSEKLLVELNHQLQCCEKQLTSGTEKKHMVIARMEVLQKEIKRVKQELEQAREKQAAY